MVSINVRRVARNPVFHGLPEVFEVMESHVGQVAYVPEGWDSDDLRHAMAGARSR